MILMADNTDPTRLDVWLSAALGTTRSQVKRMLDSDGVLVNGAHVKAGYVLRGGECLDVTGAPNVMPEHIEPENIPLDIVYEDDCFAVVNKPQGMVVHPASGVYTGTLVNALLYRFGSLSETGGAVRPGIVHRLDKDTSGLLVVAKTNAAHVDLAAQIGAKTAHRAYLALCEGVMKRDEYDIETGYGRDPKDRKKMTVLAPNEGKVALTHCDVLARYGRFTLVQWVLGTGRTHQIRVHARCLGHPVVGDRTYGYAKQSFDLAGQLLHAWRLELTHPESGKRMAFTAPVPPYFHDTLAALGTPSETLPAASIIQQEKVL